MPLTATELNLLTAAAMNARLRAYAPYSQFLVGAAILTHDGAIIEGCNVENASYGLTICAERSAVFAAVSQGHHQWRAIAIASEGAATPCGACRQVLHEFDPATEVIVIDARNGSVDRQWTVGSLLPGAFSL